MKLSVIVTVLVGALLLVGSPSTSKGRGSGSGSTMGRLRTIGFEVGLGSTGSPAPPSLDGGAVGTATLDSAFGRSGLNSLKCDSGAGNSTSFWRMLLRNPQIPALGTTTYLRAYFYFDSLPSAAGNIIIMRFENAPSSSACSARLTSAGKLKLWNDVISVNTQIGSDSISTLVPNTWYRIELSFTTSATANTQAAELRLDGQTVASGVNINGLTNATIFTYDVGWQTAPGANVVCHVDDMALNSSVGTTQNTWPGEGNIVLSKPVSDNARGGWTAGAGGTTNLWDAVDNTPPVGVAVASETNASQIKNLVSSATDNCDINMTDYLTAGVGPTDTITLVQAVCEDAEGASSGTKGGALLIVSNPVQSAEDTFNYGEDLGTAGTWPTFWQGFWGTAQVGDIPAASRVTAPVLRVGKRTATTSEVDVAFMGLYIEYTAGPTIASLSQTLNAVKSNLAYRQ